jgi:hypothetical protein
MLSARPAQFSATSRLLAAAAVVVDGAGDQFLAGAAFAHDEHGNVAGGHLPGGGDDLPHRLALADDPLEARLLGDLLLQGLILLLQGAAFGGAIHLGAEIIQVQRLFDVIVGAVVQGLFAGGDVGVGGHQNHRRRRRKFLGEA